MKRVISIVLVLMLACSLLLTGGCSKSSSSSTSSNSAPDNVVIYVQDVGGSKVKDWPNNALLQEIQKKTNTTITLNFVAPASYNDQLTTLAASGQFPDMACYVTPGTKMLQSWIDNKIIVPFEGAVAKAAPLVLKEYKDNPQLTEILVNNKIYYQPLDWGTGLQPNGPLIHVRKDLLDKFGMAIPDTWDQYVEYLKKCVSQEHLQGVVFDENEKTSGLQGCMNAYLGSYGIPNSGWVKKGNSYSSWIVQPDSIKAVLAFRQLFAAGLVDPAVWTMGLQGARAAFVSGKAGSMLYNGGGNIGRIQNDMSLVNPNFKEVLLPAPNCGGSTRGYSATPMWAGGTVIGGGSKNHPVAAARVINYLITDEGTQLAAIGIEGRDYKKEGDKIVELPQKYNDGFPTEGGAMGAHPLATGIVNWQPRVPWQEFTLLYGKDQTYVDWYQSQKQNQIKYSIPTYGLNVTSPLWLDFQATGTDLMNRALVAAFKAKSDSEATQIWTKFQSDWLAAGGDKATQEISQVLSKLYK